MPGRSRWTRSGFWVYSGFDFDCSHRNNTITGWACLMVNSCPLLCLQKQVAKLVTALFYFWSLLHKNNISLNLQIVNSIYGRRRFCHMWLLNADIMAGNAARQWLLILISHVASYCMERRMNVFHGNPSRSFTNPLLVRDCQSEQLSCVNSSTLSFGI